MRFITLVLAVAFVVLPASYVVAQTGDKAGLIAALVRKADDARQGSPGLAEQTYRLVLRFEPANKAVAAKVTGNLAMSSAEASAAGDAAGRAIRNSSVENLRAPFAERNPAMDLVMLRMLLDDRLVGNGMYTNSNSSQFSLSVFLAVPSLTTAEVRTTYGKPSSEIKDERGYEELTYGKLRLISDRTGKIAAVVTPPSW